MFEIGISIKGERHLKYLYALLQSLNIIFDNTDQNFTVLYKDISQENIKNILRKMPWLNLIEYQGYQSKLDIPGKLNFWNELVKVSKVDNLVLLDADTLVIRDFRNFFSKDFDVGYTYKTEESENLNWILNTGVVLLKRNERSLAFFEKWTEYNNAVISDGRKIGLMERMAGAVDQGTLLTMLESRNFNQIIKVGDVKLQGFPCKILNETRCVPLTDAYIVHYKGRWREVIPEGTFTQYRPKEKCSCQYNLWKDMLKQWEEL